MGRQHAIYLVSGIVITKLMGTVEIVKDDDGDDDNTTRFVLYDDTWINNREENGDEYVCASYTDVAIRPYWNTPWETWALTSLDIKLEVGQQFEAADWAELDEALGAAGLEKWRTKNLERYRASPVTPSDDNLEIVVSVHEVEEP